MKHENEKRFEDFFVEDKYVAVKNHLYNYQLRRRAINGRLAGTETGMILEVGSGLSPIVTGRDQIVYSELSFRALQALKRLNENRGHYVVADGTRLPFRDGAVPRVVCSEVLEHVEHDEVAIGEIGRVLTADGIAYITVPHRQMYFASDDAFVGHFRRYEVSDMESKLNRCDLELVRIQKVLGPLEKVTMWSVVKLFSIIIRIAGRKEASASSSSMWMSVLEPFIKWGNFCYTILARIDAWLWPRSLSTVLLFEASRSESAKR
ncbi:MAG: class I SAM-dependent methyltransferase [Candidatus Hydrogenedentota bacterium]